MLKVGKKTIITLGCTVNNILKYTWVQASSEVQIKPSLDKGIKQRCWSVVTDVSERPICPIFTGQAVHATPLALQESLFRNAGN